MTAQAGRKTGVTLAGLESDPSLAEAQDSYCGSFIVLKVVVN